MNDLDPGEKCLTEGCHNPAQQNFHKYHGLCYECWVREEEAEVERTWEQAREMRVFEKDN